MLYLCTSGTPEYFDQLHDAARGSLAGAASQSVYLRQCDLRSLVRTVYTLDKKMSPTDSCLGGSAQSIGQFWQQHLSTGLWLRAMLCIERMTLNSEHETYGLLRGLLVQL